MTNLITGANKVLTQIDFKIKHSVPSKADVTVFRLSKAGKVTGDNGIIFYNQPKAEDGSIQLLDQMIQLDLRRLDDTIDKLAVSVTLDQNTIASLPDFSLQGPDFTCHIETAGRSEAALILLDIYRHQGQWKIRFINQGFNGGLHPLAVHYGIDIASPAPPTLQRPNSSPRLAPTPTPPKCAPVASREMLFPGSDRLLIAEPSDSLYVHLDWRKKSGGFFGGTNTLNLGAFIQLHNGEKAMLHILGNSVDLAPYAFLSSQTTATDVESGDLAVFPGSHLSEINRILFFAFDYDKCPAWKKYQAALQS